MRWILGLFVIGMMISLVSAAPSVRLGTTTTGTTTNVVNYINTTTSGSSYNVTYQGYFDTYGQFWYNMSDGVGSGDGSYNVSYHNVMLDILANRSNWFVFYNASYLTSSYNATYAQWAYNQSDGTDNSSWNQGLADTLYAGIEWGYNMSDGVGQGNLSWNQSLADSLYQPIGIFYNSSYITNVFNITYDWIGASWLANFTEYSQFWYNMSDGVGSGSEYTHLSNFTDDIGATITYNASYVTTNYNATYATWAYNQTIDYGNATIARTGSCPVGYVVQNTTTSGVQCALDAGESVSSGYTIMGFSGSKFMIKVS